MPLFLSSDASQRAIPPLSLEGQSTSSTCHMLPSCLLCPLVVVLQLFLKSPAMNDPLQAIVDKQFSSILSKGLAETYRQKPTFPIEFLAKWLKQYSKGQRTHDQLENSKSEKQQRLASFQEEEKSKHAKGCQSRQRHEEEQKETETRFIQKVEETQYLVDLLEDYLPSAIQQHCQEISQPLSGCYIGQLTFKRKKIEENNFQPNAEYDTEAPKIIEFVGGSASHKFMIQQVLPSETGRCYEVFKEEEPAEEVEEGRQVPKKKKYLYVPQVQKDQKIFFFRFPRLGSFACFPLRIRSCLSAEAFDKGIGDYKAFVKAKEEVEKEYSEKHAEAKTSYEQAKRKFQEHEGPQDDPTFAAEHATLEEQYRKTAAAFKEIQSNPPVIEQFKYETRQKDYVLCVDTLGLDSQMPEAVLDYIDHKVDFFKEKWEYKEYKMLLEDILQFIDEEHSLEAQDNYFKDQERTIVTTFEPQVKEQFPSREKEAEFELTLIKCAKLIKVIQEQAYHNSLQAYLHYHLPKYREIVQIVLMILGRSKAEINLPRSNSLNYRKCIKKDYIEKMIADLEKYELRRESSEAVDNEYKINKLLERLEKIDGEAVGKYNSWLYAQLVIAKQLCWARIQCRDAKIEAYEARVKAKNDRDAQILKYDEDLLKSLEAAKAELNEQTLPSFSEEDWRKTYGAENVRPQALAVHELTQFLDIE